VRRHDVQTTPGVLAFRVDESLNFANAPWLEAHVMDQIADRPDIEHVLLISSGINDVDATGLEVLETIHRRLSEIGIGFYLSDVKGPVTDRFKLAGFDDRFLREHIFISADAAIRALSGRTRQAPVPTNDRRDEPLASEPETKPRVISTNIKEQNGCENL
jgi:SulP family sulfate permease